MAKNEWGQVKNVDAPKEAFSTGSKREKQAGKGKPNLMPTHPLRRLAKHFENGANKYADRNWELGQPLSQYYDSAQRHLWSINEGDDSEDHAAAVIWNIVCYMDTLRRIEDGSLSEDLKDFPVASQKVREGTSLPAKSTKKKS